MRAEENSDRDMVPEWSMSKRSKRVRQEERKAQRELMVRGLVGAETLEETVEKGICLPELVKVNRAGVVKVEHATNCQP